MNIIDKIYNMYEEDFQQFSEYELTYEEINELTEIVYNTSCCVFPLNCFLNDVRDTQHWIKNYDTNLAYKDFCLIMWHIIEWQKSEKIKNFIYKEKEKIDEQIKKLDPDYNETIADCEECEMWSKLFAKQELLDKIIKEVFENDG